MKQALKFLATLCVIFSLYYFGMTTPFLFENPEYFFLGLAVAAVLLVLLSALLRRHKFTRRLKKLCRTRNLDLELHGFWRMQFVVRTEVGSFAGVVAPSVFRWVPILFDEDGKKYRHVWGIRTPVRPRTRRNAVRMVTESRPSIVKAYALYFAPGKKLSFPAGYVHKFVIVNPMPLQVMVGEVQKFIYADNGEQVKDYRLYSGGAFCDFLDRQTATYRKEWDEA